MTLHWRVALLFVALVIGSSLLLSFAFRREAMTASLILLPAPAATVVAARHITRPLMQLAESVEAFGRGEPFDSNRVPGGSTEVRLPVNNFERMARERLSAILSTTPDFVGMADLEGKVTYLNRAARAMVGLDQQADLVRIEASTGNGLVNLIVADDGNGIPPEYLARIFDPFFTTRLGQGGSGLGLLIVYNIVVRVLGGRIRAASEPGRGAVFTLQLPLQAQETPGTHVGKTIAIDQRQDTP